MDCSALYEYRWFLAYATTWLSIVFGLIFADMALDGTGVWDDFNSTSYRCEDVRPDNLMRERFNAMSNTAFAVVGLYVLFAVGFDRKFGVPKSQMVPVPTPILVVFGVSCLYGGGGSWALHACETCTWGGPVDLHSVYVLVVSYMCLGCVALLSARGKLMREDGNPEDPRANWSRKRVSIISLTVWAVFSFIFWWWDELIATPLAKTGFAIQYLLIIAMLALGGIWGSMAYICRRDFTPQHAGRFFAASVLLLFLALATWWPEEVDRVCAKVGAGVLHGFWHIFVSLTLFPPYLFLRCVGNPRVAEEGLLPVLFLRAPGHSTAAVQDVNKSGAPVAPQGSPTLTM